MDEAGGTEAGDVDAPGTGGGGGDAVCLLELGGFLRFLRGMKDHLFVCEVLNITCKRTQWSVKARR